MDLLLFWRKNKVRVLSFIIALFAFPLHFSRALPYSYDGGWMTSLNLALKNKLVFGKDFIFTYGPLGVLSTRCNLYVSNFLLLAGDVFFVIGCFHFLNRQVLVNKGWGVIAFLTMLIFRTTVFSQSLFVIFIIYAALALLNNFDNYFEIAYCALAAVILFFIKINYGMLAIAGLGAVAIVLAFKDIRGFFLLLLVSVGSFSVICWVTNIDIVGYFEYSFEIISQYDEAGYWPIKRLGLIYLSGICFEVMVVAILCWFAYVRLKARSMGWNAVFFLCCISAACLVLYRNAYTRADYYHYGEYFATMPFLLLAIVMISGFRRSVWSKVVVLFVALVSWYDLIKSDVDDNTVIEKLRSGYYAPYFSPLVYAKGIFEKRNKNMEPIRLLNRGDIAYIGKRTVDIFPWETELLHYYNFNYHPRPLPQTCGYAGFFDSLNADFFSRSVRPELVMMQNFPIDYKYFFWEEPVTKNALRLNYRYDTFIRVNNWAGQLKDGYFDTYVLLRSRGDTMVQPQFEKMATRTARLGENVILDFPQDEAIYMTVKFRYTTKGKVRRMLYQPPNMHVVFRYDDGNAGVYRVSVSSLKQPVLVNKVMQNQLELRNFFAGQLTQCRNMRSFCFQPVTGGFEKEYTMEFVRLKNY